MLLFFYDADVVGQGALRRRAVVHVDREGVEGAALGIVFEPAHDALPRLHPGGRSAAVAAFAGSLAAGVYVIVAAGRRPRSVLPLVLAGAAVQLLAGAVFPDHGHEMEVPPGVERAGEESVLVLHRRGVDAYRRKVVGHDVEAVVGQRYGYHAVVVARYELPVFRVVGYQGVAHVFAACAALAAARHGEGQREQAVGVGYVGLCALVDVEREGRRRAVVAYFDGRIALYFKVAGRGRGGHIGRARARLPIVGGTGQQHQVALGVLRNAAQRNAVHRYVAAGGVGEPQFYLGEHAHHPEAYVGGAPGYAYLLHVAHGDASLGQACGVAVDGENSVSGIERIALGRIAQHLRRVDIGERVELIRAGGEGDFLLHLVCFKVGNVVFRYYLYYCVAVVRYHDEPAVHPLAREVVALLSVPCARFAALGDGEAQGEGHRPAVAGMPAAGLVGRARGHDGGERRQG